MILTVTPSPTVDRAVFVRGFRLGEIVRGEREVLTPSGKGVDVSLVVRALGRETLALGLQAGRMGRLARELLDERGVPHEFVEAEGETRHALVLVDRAAGAQSTVTVATLQARPAHLEALRALVAARAGRASFVVLAGSLPAGWPPDAYRPLLAACQAAGARTLLDTSGAALAAALEGGAGGGTIPEIVKVNRAELAAVRPGAAAGLGAEPLAAEVEAARAQLGLGALVVTLGAGGALAAAGGRVWLAEPPHVEVVSDAGAGDALAAGLVTGLAEGLGWPEALRRGTGCAAATVAAPGTAECDPQLAEELAQATRVREVA